MPLRKSLLILFAIPILFSAKYSVAENVLSQDQQGGYQPDCATPLDKSVAMIEFVLADVKSTYTQVGGGGITGIKQSFTNTLVVSIAQEERIDQLTYELTIGEDCKVKILNKKSSAINFNK